MIIHEGHGVQIQAKGNAKDYASIWISFGNPEDGSSRMVEVSIREDKLTGITEYDPYETDKKEFEKKRKIHLKGAQS